MRGFQNRSRTYNEKKGRKKEEKKSCIRVGDFELHRIAIDGRIIYLYLSLSQKVSYIQNPHPWM